MASFRNVKFDREISWGAEFTAEFMTHIAVTGTGEEYRDTKWANGKLSFQVAHMIKQQAEADWIIAFFRLCKGRGHTFRFQDRFDHRATNSPIATADGAQTVFALYKLYDDGLEQLQRRIVLPDPDETFTLYADGVPVNPAEYTINYVGGIITWTPNQTISGNDIAANEITGAYWLESSGTNLEVLNVNDKITIEGFTTAGNNVTSPDIAIVQEVDVGNNRVRIDWVLVDEAAGNTITIKEITPPAAAVVLSWTGRFDIPARFGLDKLTGDLVDYDVYNFPDIPIQEVRAEELIREFGLPF